MPWFCANPLGTALQPEEPTEVPGMGVSITHTKPWFNPLKEPVSEAISQMS
ncbi:hypothetical protein Nmel_000509 [Mimus melanotis]